ncbi:MAG: deoxyribodipyrimidine photo-lyase [Ardenticatenaceae bacterium]
MMKPIIEDVRIQPLNRQPICLQPSRYVLYWMQQSQRAEYNHALEYAIEEANALGQPLLVAFGLTDDYPEANLRHYTFMLEGLQDVQRSLRERGIKMVVRYGAPDEVALALGREASLIVCDRGYLRIQRAWRQRVAEAADCKVVQVESDVVVPIEVVSQKREYAARTIRPRIHRHLDRFLLEPPTFDLNHPSLDLDLDVAGLELTDLQRVLDDLKLDRTVPPVSHLYVGGESEGKRILKAFLDEKFADYDRNRNQPQTDNVSHMSKYLHFGQISPLYLALEILKLKQRPDIAPENIDSYIEELIVRRELAMNFVYYTPDYDAYTCLPNWAAKTLAEHREDHRPDLYTREELEEANTHDPYWNAAMKEMKYTGYMHNYMRMYWGKKILEWSATPEEAFASTLAINNKYLIDGRDANSYTGVAWIFGVHDRAWRERPIFGKTRYMNAAGLKRKCDIKGYVRKVNRLIKMG